MRRRRFMKLVGASSAVGAAGCVGGNGEDVVWSHGVGGHIDALNDGTVYGGEVWQDGNGSVFALDASDGTVRWTHGGTHGMSTHTRPVVGAEGVYFGWADDAVGSGSGDLYAVGFDGTERWTHDVGSVYDPPVVRDGAVYVGGDTGAVYGFDESGEKLWRFTPETETERQPFEASVVDVEEGVVYAVAGGVVFAVDAVECEGLWRFGEGSVSTPHVDDGTVYFSGTGCVAACADGEEVWSHEVEGTNSWVRGVTSGNVYFRHKYDLRVLDAETGDERWSVNMEDGYVTAFGDDTVYAGVDGLHAFAHDGGELWTVELDGSEIDGMTVGNGYVYAVTEKEAHRIEEGEKEGSTEIPDGNVLSHVATDGRVYVGSREGVYALGV